MIALLLVLSLVASTGLACAGEHAVPPGALVSILAEAQPGDTLRLLPGTHSGPLTIPIPIRLVGVPGAVIDGGGQGTVLTLTADGIQVVDLAIRGSGSDLSQDDAVVLLREARGIRVERCHIEARAFGIYLRAGGGHHIVHNKIRGDASLPPSRRGNGIHLWHTEGNEVQGNSLIKVRDGMYLSFAHHNLIRDNQGAELRYGIHYMYSEHNTLIANRFHNCSGGITLMFSKDNHVEGNEVRGNRGFGILCLQLERSVLVRNRVAFNGRGIFIENSARNRFVENRVEENGVGVFLTAGSETNVFTGNGFAGNLVQAFHDHAEANQWSENGRGNAWSDYAGFDWNGDGVGEMPYRVQTAVSALMVRQPTARWFLASPVLALFDWWEAHMLVPAGAFLDPAPLVVFPGDSSGGKR